MSERDILNIDEAAELLGVSIKTFNKVLHAERLPARKIGREWKFSRAALIAWVGSGCSQDFYNADREEPTLDGAELAPQPRHGGVPSSNGDGALDGRPVGAVRTRRTAGWQLEMD
jgi:excisionase family DNA binding protein